MTYYFEDREYDDFVGDSNERILYKEEVKFPFGDLFCYLIGSKSRYHSETIKSAFFESYDEFYPELYEFYNRASLHIDRSNKLETLLDDKN